MTCAEGVPLQLATAAAVAILGAALAVAAAATAYCAKVLAEWLRWRR